VSPGVRSPRRAAIWQGAVGSSEHGVQARKAGTRAARPPIWSENDERVQLQFGDGGYKERARCMHLLAIPSAA
jgi:hypothetical protein